MNNAQNSDWSSIPPCAVWLIFIAIFGPLIAFLLGGLRERYNWKRKAIDQYRNVIATQLAELDANRWSEAVFYAQSVPIITNATYSFRPFTSNKCRIALDSFLAKYQSHHESEFAPGHARAVAAIKKELGVGGLHHFELLKDYLNRFDDIAKEA